MDSEGGELQRGHFIVDVRVARKREGQVSSSSEICPKISFSFVENFRLDLVLFRVQQLALIIGARCYEREGKDKGQTHSLALKHPWTFPKVSAGTPRKRKRD